MSSTVRRLSAASLGNLCRRPTWVAPFPVLRIRSLKDRSGWCRLHLGCVVVIPTRGVTLATVSRSHRRSPAPRSLIAPGHHPVADDLMTNPPLPLRTLSDPGRWYRRRPGDPVVRLVVLRTVGSLRTRCTAVDVRRPRGCSWRVLVDLCPRATAAPDYVGKNVPDVARRSVHCCGPSRTVATPFSSPDRTAYTASAGRPATCPLDHARPAIRDDADRFAQALFGRESASCRRAVGRTSSRCSRELTRTRGVLLVRLASG